MSEVLLRSFHRADREQVTALVNAHIAAVVPNMSVSVQTLLSQLEREPGEFIVDPWVRERLTMVAEQRDRVVAAAHLLRYGDDAPVSASYRGTGEIRWLVAWPDAPYWPDATDAAHRLDDAARTSRTGSWADVGNLHVAETHRRRGIGTWLLAQAAEWLTLGEVNRLLHYTEPGDEPTEAFLRSTGFRILTKTTRDYALGSGEGAPHQNSATTSVNT